MAAGKADVGSAAQWACGRARTHDGDRLMKEEAQGRRRGRIGGPIAKAERQRSSSTPLDRWGHEDDALGVLQATGAAAVAHGCLSASPRRDGRLYRLSVLEGQQRPSVWMRKEARANH